MKHCVGKLFVLITISIVNITFCGYPESIHLEYHVPQGVDNDSITDYTVTDFKVIKE